MTTIRKIVTSQVNGNDANSLNNSEIRPFGEASFYIDDNGNTDKLALLLFDGQRTNLKSKILSPGIFYGSNANSGDGYGADTIRLVPDAELYYNDGSYGNDQYLIVDPTSPNHIHIRAGGPQDASTAELFLGGELTNINVSDTYDRIVVRTSDTSGGSAIPKEWIFDNTGKLSFPIFGAIEPVGMGWFGITNGESGGPISILQKSINVAYTGQPLSDISMFNDLNWTTGNVRIGTQNLAAGTSYQWTFDSDGKLVFPGMAEITDTTEVTAAGTKITVSLNAAGDTEDYVGGSSVLEVPTNTDTDQVQAGWIITFAGGIQRTVSFTGQAGGYTSIYYNESNPGLGSSTYPLTIQSANYTEASAGATTITKGNYTWSFNSEGELTFPDSTVQLTAVSLDQLEVDGQTILTTVDDSIKIQTSMYPTISWVAAAGSGEGVFVADISESDDIIVVDSVTWQFNTGSELAPIWTTVTSTVIDPGVTFTINVTGATFTPNTTYTFRNISEDTYQWTFNTNGTLIAPKGSILSNETSALPKREYLVDKVGNYYWDGVNGLYISTVGDTIPAFLLTETIEAEIGQLSPATNNLTLRMTDGDGNNIVGVCSSPTSINNSFSYNQLGGNPGLFFLLNVEWTSSALPAINTLTALTSFSLDQGTYKDFNIELLEPHGQFEQRLVFRNDGSLEIPELIQLGNILMSSTQNGLSINSYGNTWTFDTNGHLNVPNEIANTSTETILGIRSNAGARLQYIKPIPTTDLGVLNQSLVTVNASGVKLEIKSSDGADSIGDLTNWEFNINGEISFPDNTVQTTAWAGGRVVTVPTTSIGVSGDKAGDIAFNNGYMYYCTADYTSTPTTVSWTNVQEVDDGLGDHYIRADIATPSQLSGVLSITNIMENGVSSALEPVTSYSLITGNTYKFYLGNTNNPWNSLQISTLQVVPNIWRRIAWSGDTW